MSDPVVVEQYERMSDDKRLEFLQSHIGDSTNLSEAFLLEALRSEDDATAQWYLVKGLGLHRSVSAVPLIMRRCQKADVDLGHTTLHRICAWALGRIGNPALPRVLELLKEGDVSGRACAADTLGEIKDPRVASALCDTLEHDERHVALWAALSLAKLGEAALPCLHDIVNRTQGAVRYLALDTILKIGRQESLYVVSNILRSGEREEKLLVLETGRAFFAQAAQAIVELTTSNDAEIVQVAKGALASMQRPRGAAQDPSGR